MDIRTTLTSIGRRLAPLAALALVTAGILAFADDKIPHFWELPTAAKRDPAVTDKAPETTRRSSGGSSPEGTSASVVWTPDLPAELRYAMNESDVLRLAGGEFSPFSVADAQAAGYSRTIAPYTQDASLLVRSDGFPGLPRDRSLYDKWEKKLRYERPDTISAPAPVYDEELTEMIAVQPYMGMILVCYENGEEIYSAEGEYLETSFADDPKPAYTRDRKGNPLFSRQETERVERVDEDGKKIRENVTVTKYYTLSADGFQPADYDDAADNRGLYFDYPATWGVADDTHVRFIKDVTTVTEHLDGTETEETSPRYAYGYSVYSARTTYRFYGAWDFHEGLAAVLDENKRLYYVNSNFYKAFTTESNFYYYERYMLGYLLPPITNGIESLGFFYYDHGLVRARRQYVDWYGLTYLEKLRVSLDEDFLMDTKGKEFELPEGCKIVSYSDGVILLECEGKYGYMDATGAWIAQPIYDRAQPFIEGLAVCGFADGTMLMLDTSGSVVIPAGTYNHISNCSSGVIAAWDYNRGWDVLWKVGNAG